MLQRQVADKGDADAIGMDARRPGNAGRDHARRGRQRRCRVEREAEAGDRRNVASGIGLPDFDAVGPSTAVKALLQVLPPSVEYSTSAPGSTPARASVPSLVTWSIAELPVSFASDTPGAAGGVVSIV